MIEPASHAAAAVLIVVLLAQLGVSVPDVRLRALADEVRRLDEDEEETVRMAAVESAH